MRIVIAAVGKAKSGPERKLFDDYVARIPWRVETAEVDARSERDAATRKDREAELLLAKVPAGARVVALDERGTALASAAFAKRLAAWRDGGVKAAAFLIGGADGHGEAVRARADLCLAFGPMTWPHLLVRAMLAEQLYRASAIIGGHPYHRA
ncbi:MAG: 23S rRNA (pseudouridine(1915)-N(3))-methyltransferase RlmH [Rhodospirillaceae bacterium]|nr:23S rRNA (pseudouridine(1915)-N(3))-methyltransferase RlmH [Rhodospirillaceae bacterium]